MPLPDRLLLDTNCFIYLLEDPSSARGAFLATHVFAAAVAGQQRLFASTLTETELLSQPSGAGQSQRASALLAALEGLPGLEFVPLTVTVAADAARLRGQLGLSVPDAIVVASALAVQATLITNDRRLHHRDLEPPVLLLDDLLAAP